MMMESMKYRSGCGQITFAVVLGFVAAGCAGTGDFQQLADGSYQVVCSGGYHDWQGCYADAKKACQGGDYVIKSRVSDEGSSSTGSKDFSAKGSQVTRSMTVMCK